VPRTFNWSRFVPKGTETEDRKYAPRTTAQGGSLAECGRVHCDPQDSYVCPRDTMRAIAFIGIKITTLVGTASVVDGDPIEIHGERIRFHGIDAPRGLAVVSRGGRP